VIWIFFYLSPKWSKSCAQTMTFKFSEKFKFWPNSKTNVAPPCGIVQMYFQTFERAFLPLKKAEIHIKIDLQMSIISLFEWLNHWCANPLFKFKIPSVTNKTNKNSNFSFSCRCAAADLHQTLQVNRWCPYHFCMPLDFFQRDQQFQSWGTPKIFFLGGGECPITVFCLQIPNLPTKSHQMLTTSVDRLPLKSYGFHQHWAKGSPLWGKVGIFFVFEAGNPQISASQGEIWQGRGNAVPNFMLIHELQNRLLSNFNTDDCLTANNDNYYNAHSFNDTFIHPRKPSFLS